MARSQAFTCDRPDCDEFHVGDSLPPSWVSVVIECSERPGRFDLCSNLCLTLLALERHNSEPGPTSRRMTLREA